MFADDIYCRPLTAEELSANKAADSWFSTRPPPPAETAHATLSLWGRRRWGAALPITPDSIPGRYLIKRLCALPGPHAVGVEPALWAGRGHLPGHAGAGHRRERRQGVAKLAQDLAGPRRFREGPG